MAAGLRSHRARHPPRPPGAPPRRWVGPVLLAAATLLGVAHAAAVWPHYHVGSFDDDASYLETAQALLRGAGLTSPLPAGYPLAATYPPGFPALLVPLVALSGGSVLPERLFSLALFAALFPLTWHYLGGRGISWRARAVVLALLALGPVAATYAGMVMAEMPFLVALVLLHLVVARWDRDPRRVGPAAVGAVVLAAALVWLKEAGIGIAAGLVCWQLLRRRPGRAAAVAAGVGALLLPVVLARLVAGTPLLGARYSTEIGGYLAGGLLHRVVSVAPHALGQILSSALPLTVVPTGVSPLPTTGVLAAALGLLRVSAAPLTLLGLAVYARRHRDAAVLTVPVYIAEVLFFPYVNERRVILVLPIVLAWYVLGAGTLLGWLAAGARRLGALAGWLLPGLATAAAAALVLGALVPQFPRDYLLALGASTSHPRGSPYLDTLARLGPASAVVETDYLWTTSWLTGHRTAEGAYAQAETAECAPGPVHAALVADHASYALTAALNSLGLASPCLLGILDSQPWSVPLLATAADTATVFALTGPGTTRPGEQDLLRARTPAVSAPVSCPPPLAGCAAGAAGAAAASWAATGGVRATAATGAVQLTWTWQRPRRLSLVSVQLARALGEGTGRVALQLRSPRGRWATVASAAGPVDGPAAGRRVTPVLLDDAPGEATGVRVVVLAAPGAAVAVAGVHALGQP